MSGSDHGEGVERTRSMRWALPAGRTAVLAAALTALLLVPAFAQMRGPASVAPVAEKLLDAVVNISTNQTLKGAEGAPLPKVPKGAPFEEFFEDFFDRKGGRGPGDRRRRALREPPRRPRR